MEPTITGNPVYSEDIKLADLGLPVKSSVDTALPIQEGNCVDYSNTNPLIKIKACSTGTLNTIPEAAAESSGSGVPNTNIPDTEENEETGTPAKKPKKWIILLVILLILGVVFSIYYYRKESNK